ncbi:MAG: thiamine-phosphate kinase, partial [Candidatus Rokuibacteriota bacterium]
MRVGIGDDCAVLEPTPGTPLLATTDLLIEDVHFRRTYATPADIGWKAFAVNLSDIASMGGRPCWALVALACPSATEVHEIEAFYAAAWALADEHHVAVVGGDTAASPSGWIVNVTLLGEAVHPPLLRSSARVGDVVAVTGPLGRSAAGLAVLTAPTAPLGLAPFDVDDVTGAHLRPVPRVREGQWLAAAGGVTAMIDLSDG